jgi:penicillin amidase
MNWNYVLDKSSVAAGIYAMWERQILINAGKEFIPAELKSLLSMQLSRVIERVNKLDQKEAFLKKSFEQAIVLLKNKLGNSTTGWTYGQDLYKHVTIQHPLNSLIGKEARKRFNTATMPRGGNGTTPGSTGGADNQLSGASFRLLVDTEDWDKTLMINTPGQSGDPNSPFYKNLFSLWANDEYFPSYFSKDKIQKTTVEKILMQPVK